MKFSLDSGLFLRGIKAVRGAAARKSTMPILANVMLRADGDTLTLAATDLDVSVVAVVPGVRAAFPGTFTVNAQSIADLVHSLKGDVECVLDGGMLVVSAGRTRFKIHGTPADDFPRLPDAGGKEVSGGPGVAEAMAAVRYATSTDETRFVLNGVLVTSRMCVATDGHRMAFALVDAGLGDRTVIVPNRAVDLMRRMDTLSVSDTHIFASYVDDGISVTTSARLIEGKYPDYKQVVPKDTTGVVVCDRDVLLACVGRVAAVLKAGSGSQVRLKYGDSQLTVSAQDALLGEASDGVDVTTGGTAGEIGLNAHYLADALRKAPAGDVALMFNDALSPVMVKSGDVITAIVMPMRI